MQTATLTTPPTAPASISINKTQIARPRTKKVQSQKEPQKNRNAPNSFPHQTSGFTTATAGMLPVPTAARTSAKPSVSAFTRPSLENTKGISTMIDPYPRTLNWTDVIEEPPQESTQTLKSTTASETTLHSELYQRTTTRNTTMRHSTTPPFLSSSASPMLIPTSLSLSNQNALTDNVATPIFHMTTNVEVKPHEPSRHNADPQPLTEKVAASSEVHPNARFTTETTYFMDSNLLHSIPTPALVTVKPLNSKLTPSLWSGNYFWHKSYPEIAEKGKKQGVSVVPTPGLPENATHASNWDIQKTAEKSHFEKTPVQIITPELLPTEPLSRNMFERPRIVGGKAASFTVPANSDAFLPCEAIGNPLPTIHWTRVSSGI